MSSSEPLLKIELDMSLDQGGGDVFEAFEDANGDPVGVDAQEIFRERRESDPVRLVPPAERIGAMAVSERPTYEVYLHEDVSRVAQESNIFTSEHHSDTIGKIFGRSILEMNGEEHTLHRRLIQHAFKSKELARWKQGLIPLSINRTIDSFAGAGRCDLVRDFALRYPVKVIEGMMGLPDEHSDWFHRRSIQEIMIFSDPALALQAGNLLREYFRQVVEIRREHPGVGDMISLLISASIGERQLTTEEILPFLMLLAPAGAETTFRGTSSLLYGLLSNPDQLEQVKADRSLIPRAVEEAMRWEPPLPFLGRRVSADVSFHGVEIAAGSNIAACLASANRDPRHWEPADTVDEFDIFRPRKANLTFAAGAHVCLGMLLARAEMEEAVNAVLDRLPNLRLDPNSAGETRMTGATWRSPNQLPVVWDV